MAIGLAISMLGLVACQPRSGVSYVVTDGSDLKIGESYKYLGDGKFEHLKVINWKDLK